MKKIGIQGDAAATLYSILRSRMLSIDCKTELKRFQIILSTTCKSMMTGKGGKDSMISPSKRENDKKKRRRKPTLRHALDKINTRQGCLRLKCLMPKSMRCQPRQSTLALMGEELTRLELYVGRRNNSLTGLASQTYKSHQDYLCLSQVVARTFQVSRSL